jgi:Gnt-I system low-affinity gluconate transporter
MSTPFLIFIVVSAVGLLLFMVLKLKVNAFITLLITAIYVGIITGMPLNEITKSIQNGMAGTLGFVATVVGLGAIFGQMLESSGGAESLARYLLKKFGDSKASWAMMITGFLVAIPIFLDVGFIILVPIIYALARDSKKSLLYYGIPLLAGLAVTHSFVPPTPGPVAVADIIQVPLGWVIFLGIVIGFPVAVIAGPIWGKYISGKIYVEPPAEFMNTGETEYDKNNLPPFGTIAFLISVPLMLILFNTLTGILVKKEIVAQSIFTDSIEFIGHPFSALIIATLFSVIFCLRRGMDKQKILQLSNKALAPAGLIILITGAGGVLKQVLVDSGIGKIMAESLAGSALPPIVLAWLLAAIVRLAQGSATVAMITAAGILAPALGVFNLSEPQLALIVLSIASGATIASHVNDSGFWLVGKYLGMTEKQTLQSWTVMETIIAVCGLAFVLLASLFF